jgi:pyruvate dehydrogenase E1 component alpha subunit
VQALTEESQARIFRRMLLMRRFEERCVELNHAKEIAGLVSVAIGQEVTAALFEVVLDPQDLLFGNHRSHNHLLGRGGDPARLMAEIFGRASGYCGGKAGTWHVSASEVGVSSTSAVVAANTALATGAALAFKQQGKRSVAVSCFGDRSLNEGTTWEALNMAALWRLPVLFLCENNDARPYDPPSRSSLSAERLTDLVEPFGIASRSVDGADLHAVHTALAELVDVARTGRPAFLEVETMRWPASIAGGGYTKGTDPTRLADAWDQRTHDVPEAWRSWDPVIRAARQMTDDGIVSREHLEALDDEVATEIEQAIECARRDAWPDPSAAFEGVFSG